MKKRNINTIAFVFITIAVVMALLSACTHTDNGANISPSQTDTKFDQRSIVPSQQAVPTQAEASASEADDAQDLQMEEEDVPFYAISIPDEVRERMQGRSMKESAKIAYDDLSYLCISYYGYDDETHVGEMVVAKELAEEVLSIFKELYENRFPIERMHLIDDYEADDETSMQHNNTSAFNYRLGSNVQRLSNHAFGRVIDINPYYNPYIRQGKIEPRGVEAYLDRELNEKGMIKDDGICVEIFKKYGWSWGGEWKSRKDYMHFEKPK